MLGFGKNKEKKRKEFAMAVVGLIINLQILPGIGSLVGGRRNEGLIQLLMAIVAVIMMLNEKLLILGGIIMVIAWLWGLMTGVKMVTEKAP